jgi:hypothetical protein
MEVKIRFDKPAAQKYTVTVNPTSLRGKYENKIEEEQHAAY